MGKSLVERFAVIEDPRRGRVTHDLVEMLVIVTCGVLAKQERFVEIADWAQIKAAWFRRFLRLDNGIPSHDTMNRLFRLLDPKAFESVFRTWVADVMPAFTQIAIDGKSLRGSGTRSPVHLVSAFATDLGLVLAQQRVADKGGELGAVPELLAALDLRGCLVSLDAQGCQREIARQIRARGADYLLAVKGNQPTLREALEDAFADQADAPAHESNTTGHGRQTLQIAQVLQNTGQVDAQRWPDCRSLARVLSLRIENGQARRIEQRYYISSAELDADTFAAAVRRHWAVENDLHWRLDVTLREDACVVQRDHAPENLSIVRRIVLNLLKLDPTHPKLSVRRRAGLAAWDDDERERVFGIVVS